MAMLSIDELGIPLMRGNPFSLRPIEAEEAEALIGRRDILREWNEHIRSNSPRLIALYGERGSGRTSLLQAAATWTPHSHHAHIWPETDVVPTVLTELFVSFADFEAPHSTELIGSRLVEMLARIEGPLPLIAFDHPSAQGLELAGMLQRILPILNRLRALCIVTVTPAQYSSWSNEIRDAFDVSGPLNPFTEQEVASLIENRFRSVSTNGWQPDPSFISAVLHRTGGQPAAVIRLLRDIVDTARGVRSTPIGSFFDIQGEAGILSTEHRPSDQIKENNATNDETRPDGNQRYLNPELSNVQPQAHLASFDDIGQSSAGIGIPGRSELVVEPGVSSSDFIDPWEPVDVPGRSNQAGRMDARSQNSDILPADKLGRFTDPLTSRTRGDMPNPVSESVVSHSSESDLNRMLQSNASGDSLESQDASIGIDRGEDNWQSRVFGEDDEKPIYLEEQRGKTEGIDSDDAFSPFAEWGDEEDNSDDGSEGGVNHNSISRNDISEPTDAANPVELIGNDVNSGSISNQHESFEQIGRNQGSSHSESHSEKSNYETNTAEGNAGAESKIQDTQKHRLDSEVDLSKGLPVVNEGLPGQRDIDQNDNIDVAENSQGQFEEEDSSGILANSETNSVPHPATDIDGSAPHSANETHSGDLDSLSGSPETEVEATQMESQVGHEQIDEATANPSLFKPQGGPRSMAGGAFSALADRSRGNISSRNEGIAGDSAKFTRNRMRPTGPIQAKPDLDIPNVNLETSPVHVFDGGALWVDDASREKFEPASNSDDSKNIDEKTNQPFTLPTSPSTVESESRDITESPTSPTFYRSQDGTSLLEIQDGYTPPALVRNETGKPIATDAHQSHSADITNTQDNAALDSVSSDEIGESLAEVEQSRTKRTENSEFRNSGDYRSQSAESFDGDSDNEATDFESEEIDEDNDEEVYAELPKHGAGVQPTRERDEGRARFGDLKSRLKNLREPRWEPDRSLDHLRMRALSNHEILVIEAAVSREISPSDQRLQARLQVGRSRLSQIYNGLYRAGILSARKEGRLRYFKLSSGAIEHLEGAV